MFKLFFKVLLLIYLKDEPFQINLTRLLDRQNISEYYASNGCFWTNANITAEGVYSGPGIIFPCSLLTIFEDAFRKKSIQKTALLELDTNKNLDIYGWGGKFCLGLAPKSIFITADDFYQGIFFCENDIYDEQGRVKMYVGRLDACEHLKLNLTFIVEKGLFNGQHRGTKYVIKNYQSSVVSPKSALTIHRDRCQIRRRFCDADFGETTLKIFRLIGADSKVAGKRTIDLKIRE